MPKWILVGKPKGKGLLGKPRFRHEDNIKMDLKGDAKICTRWV
jgi:hypothetical protein